MSHAGLHWTKTSKALHTFGGDCPRPGWPFRGSVRGLLTGSYELGRFDLIHTTGLYDYFAPRTARRLTEPSFKMLWAGGVLRFTNFAKNIPDDGYTEICMDWKSTVSRRERSEQRMPRPSSNGRRLAGGIVKPN